MGFHFGAGAVCGIACLVGMMAWAMPTAEDFEKARPVVESAAAGKTAEKVQALVSEAETEAGKYLLLERAASLYVQAKDYDKAADALEALQKEIPDIPAAAFVDLVKSVVKPISRAKDAPRLAELLKAAQAKAKDEAAAAAAKARAEKELAAVRKQLAAKPGDKPLLWRQAELLALAGDWEGATVSFLQFGGKAAKAAADET